MHFLDTDTLTRPHAGNANIEARIRQVGEDQIATTVISAIEVLQGRHAFLLKAGDGEQLVRAQNLLSRSQEMLRSIRIILIDTAVAAEFDRWRHDKNLKKIGRADLLIACVTLAHRATLVSRNVKHFRQVPGLRVENWFD